MGKSKKKYLVLVSLFLFFFMSAFINFFHTEKTATANDFCPACNFQKSSLTTSQINFFNLPPLSLIEVIESIYQFNYKKIFLIDPASRSPPQM